MRRLTDERNVYRGKVVSFGGSQPLRPAPLSVRRLPEIPARAHSPPSGPDGGGEVTGRPDQARAADRSLTAVRCHPTPATSRGRDTQRPGRS